MKKNLYRLVVSFVFVFFCLLTNDFRTAAGRNETNEAAELSALTVKIAALSGQVQTGKGEADFARFELAQLAQTRFAKMNALIEKNPSEVLRVALPDDILSKIPEDLREYFEKRAETEGALEVIAECEDHDGKTHYFLDTGKERIAVHFNKQPAEDLLTGSRVRLNGVRVGDSIAVDENDFQSEKKDFEVTESALPNTTGEIKVLVMLVNFQNDTRAPYTIAQANKLMFDNSNSSSVTNYYREASYGKTWIAGDTVGWFTLPMAADCAQKSQIATLAQQAAVNAGVNLSAYNKFMYVFPSISCGFTGSANVGGQNSWINGSLTLRTTTHELGHNLGLRHSKALDCGSEIVGSSCTVVEYGHPGDIIGASGMTGHFHPYQKERLGWINNPGTPPVTTVETNGNYNVYPNSVPDANTKALRVLKGTDSYGRKIWYYIEFRRALGFDSYLSGYSSFLNGVVITMNNEANGAENYLLDMTPGTASWTDSALLANRSFTDSSLGLTVTTLAVGSGGATVNISFNNTPAPCVLANPTVSVNPSATQWIGAGSSVDYSVTVTNNNSSNCAANSFNVQPTLPVGWSAAVTSPVLNVPAGSSATTTVRVFTPTGAADGFYQGAFAAANYNSPSHAASAPVNLAVYSALGVSVVSSQTTYTRNQSVSVTATVTANGSPMAGANVTFTLTKPNERKTVVSTVSNAGGSAVFNYRFNKKNDPPGVYVITANAGLNGVSGSGSTSFEVR